MLLFFKFSFCTSATYMNIDKRTGKLINLVKENNVIDEDSAVLLENNKSTF
jgi:hypothetical protein